jgi:hypothetical protein
MAYGLETAARESDYNIDKLRQDLLGDAVYLSVLWKGTYDNTSLLSHYEDTKSLHNLSLDEVMDRTKLDVFVKEAQARLSLERVMDSGGRMYDFTRDIEVLKRSESKRLQLSPADLAAVLQCKGHQCTEFEELMRLEDIVSPYTVGLAVRLDLPDVARALYKKLQKLPYDQATNTQSLSKIGSQYYVDMIVDKLYAESEGQSFEYDVFDAYYPILSTFRGYIIQPWLNDRLQSILKNNRKFKQAYEDGHLADTIDPVDLRRTPTVIESHMYRDGKLPRQPQYIELAPYGHQGRIRHHYDNILEGYDDYVLNMLHA